MRMRKRRILPATWPSTTWSLSSFTRNIAFGRASITSPSNSTLSSFATRYPIWAAWAWPAAALCLGVCVIKLPARDQGASAGGGPAGPVERVPGAGRAGRGPARCLHGRAWRAGFPRWTTAAPIQTSDFAVARGAGGVMVRRAVRSALIRLAGFAGVVGFDLSGGRELAEEGLVGERFGGAREWQARLSLGGGGTV